VHSHFIIDSVLLPAAAAAACCCCCLLMLMIAAAACWCCCFCCCYPKTIFFSDGPSNANSCIFCTKTTGISKISVAEYRHVTSLVRRAAMSWMQLCASKQSLLMDSPETLFDKLYALGGVLVGDQTFENCCSVKA
jgi:hypothetical protein